MTTARAPDPLSGRERQIAEACADGETYQQIAERLNLAPSTVRTHLATIYRKLGVSTKLALRKQIEAATNTPTGRSGSVAGGCTGTTRGSRHWSARSS